MIKVLIVCLLLLPCLAMCDSSEREFRRARRQAMSESRRATREALGQAHRARMEARREQRQAAREARQAFRDNRYN